MKISWIDVFVIVIYFILVLFVGIYSMYRSNKNSIQGYFLAGRFMSWFTIGSSLFASNIGSEHFIGLAGSGASSGIGVAAFELNACLILQLLGWIFLPVYLASGVCTLPEYMQKRFCSVRIQTYLALISLILYVFTKISVNLYAGSLFINESLGWNLWASISFILVFTTFITLIGGLSAVIYTDTLQCSIMLIGASCLSFISFSKLDTFSLTELYKRYSEAISPINVETKVGQDIINVLYLKASNYSEKITFDNLLTNESNNETLSNQLRRLVECRLPSRNSFIMLGEITDVNMPWLGFLLGQTPSSIWYWCADQMMVQRVLSAKTLAHAQGSTLFAGFLKQLPLFLIIFPGMISRILYPDEIACGSAEECFKVCGQTSGCSNLAYPKLVIEALPNGLRGALLSVMFAALISDLTSIFNSASTLFTVDIYHKLRKKASNSELMVVGRLFVLFMVVVSVFWVPVIQSMQSGRLYIYIQTIAANFSPPIAAVFLLAILWPKTNERGAFYGLIFGFVFGLLRLILDFIYREPDCGEVDNRILLVSKIQYMYFAMFLFIATTFCTVAVSSISTRDKSNKTNNIYCYWSANQMINKIGKPTEEFKEEICPIKGERNYVSNPFERSIRQWLGIFCGVTEGKETIANDQLTLDPDHILETTNLDPARFYISRKTRLILLSFLVIITVLTIFSYVFFSLYFQKISHRTLPVKSMNFSQEIYIKIQSLLHLGVIRII